MILQGYTRPGTTWARVVSKVGTEGDRGLWDGYPLSGYLSLGILYELVCPRGGRLVQVNRSKLSQDDCQNNKSSIQFQWFSGSKGNKEEG